MGSILMRSMSINKAALYSTEIYYLEKLNYILFSHHFFVFRAICTLLEAQPQKISWLSTDDSDSELKPTEASFS